MTFTEAKQEIEEIIYSYLPEECGPQKTIFEAMNYSMKAGGKRIRPMLMREVYRLFGGSGKEIEPMMAAMEMMHTSSLIHDDLPCMDNDEYRRGKKTTWVVFGYDMAVLAGDALMLYAFETAAKALSMTENTKACARCMQILASKSGIYGMVGGQTVDVELTGKPVPKDKLNFIYELKTGALLEASMMMGAVMANASEEDLKKVERMAGDIGLAFQIEDDILDVTASEEELGKNIGSDEKNGKVTYVTLYGMEAARQKILALTEEALTLIDTFPYSTEELKQLIRSLTSRRK